MDLSYTVAENVRLETPELLSSVLSEIENLAPWHQIAVKRRGRTATGVLGIPIDAVATFLHDIFERVPESPKDGVPVGQAFRQGCEELKTFYLEAATAKPGAAKSHELADWFWGGTAGGRLLLSLHPATLESADEGIKQVALGQMVPRAQKHRLGWGTTGLTGPALSFSIAFICVSLCNG